MTVVFSALFTAIKILPSKNYILLELMSNVLTLLLICFWPVLSWTFQFPMLLTPPTPPCLLLCTLYSLIAVPQLPPLFEIWHQSYLNLQLTLILPTLKTLFSPRSFGWPPTSHTSMMGSIIRDFWVKGMVSTRLSSSLMPTSAKKNGGSIFLTSLPTGSIYAFKAFLFFSICQRKNTLRLKLRHI